jgi:hypothetical protein
MISSSVREPGFHGSRDRRACARQSPRG